MGFTRGLIMAGGRSERMRAVAGTPHKALARVRDVTLLEWNVRLLLRNGFRDIVVAVSASEPEISEFVTGSVAQLVRRDGATLELLEEEVPLGNIGAAREAIGDADNVLMLYVDNLASIDPRRLVEYHQAQGFAVTIATHQETFHVPFGRLAIEGNRVREYAEKPVLSLQVSSGTCVLSRRACAAIPPGRPTGASELFTLLTAQGDTVGAFAHNEPWIDINDVPALQRARDLVESRLCEFHGLSLP
ncbi:MAG TPA: NTP transferase domain-containing protein [Candidatus Cybelea sp.]|nr:NTP transferase domain-containing protein [Candidatus Cybelea sp.]